MPNRKCPNCPRNTAVHPCRHCGHGSAKLWNRLAVTVTSLEEFVKIIAPLSPYSAAEASGYYWYRGQSNADWGLETSFLRMTQHLAKQRKEAICLEGEALQEFKSKAHL